MNTWSNDDQTAAMRDGWGIFEDACNSSGIRRHFFLQRNDGHCDYVFASDDEVWLHVWRKGCLSQQTLEGRALAYLLIASPEEYQEIAIYAWQQDKRAA